MRPHACSFPVLLIVTLALATGWGQNVSPTPKAKEADDGTVRTSAKEAPIIRTEISAESEDWRPIDWEPVRIKPGTALDFSVFADAPAGKHGEVVIESGNFVFKDAPGQPVRFYGPVIGHGLPYLEKAQAEQLADYLAACGYNIVRFHNFLFMPDVMKTVGSPEFNPDRRDQLDYFFYCLKQRGIYFSFPLNTWSFFKAGAVTDVPEFVGKDFRFESNGLLPISGDLQKWLQQYAVNLLCHTNPYTGMALKDDPALVSVEIANEDSLFAVINQFPELLGGVYQRLSASDLKAKLGREPTEQELSDHYAKYVVATQEAYYEKMKSYLRGIGLQKPLTDFDYRGNMIYAMQRSQLDYVDVHHYWALYKKLPEEEAKKAPEPAYRVDLTNPLTVDWGLYFSVVPARIFGRPMTASEFNSNYPTPYWIYMAPLEATLAGSQGWSAVMRCGLWPFPDVAFSQSPMVRIETAHSPVQMLSDRIAALLFTQGQIQPLPIKVPIALTSEYLFSKPGKKGGEVYPPSYYRLAMKYQLGTILADEGKEKFADYPVVVAPNGMKLPEALAGKDVRPADAELGTQLEKLLSPDKGPRPAWQTDAKKGTAQIITPKSESFLLPADVSSATGNIISVAGNKSVSVSFAGTLDGQPLPESKKILVMYLTDVRNTGTQLDYETEKTAIVRVYGKAPLLVRQGKITMSFKTQDRPLPKIWALKYDGTRAVAITPQKSPEGFTFDAQAVTDPETFSAYEVTWED